MIRRDSTIKALAILAVTVATIGVCQQPAAAQTPETTTQDDFQRMVEYLTRDGGRWRAPNPSHLEGDSRTPEAYGLWFEPMSDGKLLELTIVMHVGGEARRTMKSYWFWHPGREEIIYQEIQRNGVVREGTCHFEDEKSFVTLTQVFIPGGAVRENRGLNVMTEDDSHVTTAYSKGAGGEWVERASLTWNRTPQAEDQQ